MVGPKAPNSPPTMASITPSNVLTADDFSLTHELGEGEAEKQRTAREIADLVGMDNAKQWFKKHMTKVRHAEETGDMRSLMTCMNLVITGNPGTGKTTFVCVNLLTALCS